MNLLKNKNTGLTPFRKLFTSFAIIILAIASIYQTTEAAFSDEVIIDGTTFSVSEKQDDLKGSNKDEAVYFLRDLSKNGDEANLTRTLNGPEYEDVSVNWKQKYPLKIKNANSKDLYLVSFAMYSKDTDPDNLKDDIFASVNEWNDSNSNGKVDSDEIGKNYGDNSMLRWKNDTFKLDKIRASEIKGFVFTFDGRGLTEDNVGKKGKFSFHIEATDKL